MSYACRQSKPNKVSAQPQSRSQQWRLRERGDQYVKNMTDNNVKAREQGEKPTTHKASDTPDEVGAESRPESEKSTLDQAVDWFRGIGHIPTTSKPVDSNRMKTQKASDTADEVGTEPNAENQKSTLDRIRDTTDSTTQTVQQGSGESMTQKASDMSDKASTELKPESQKSMLEEAGVSIKDTADSTAEVVQQEGGDSMAQKASHMADKVSAELEPERLKSTLEQTGDWVKGTAESATDSAAQAVQQGSEQESANPTTTEKAADTADKVDADLTPENQGSTLEQAGDWIKDTVDSAAEVVQQEGEQEDVESTTQKASDAADKITPEMQPESQQSTLEQAGNLIKNTTDSAANPGQYKDKELESKGYTYKFDKDSGDASQEDGAVFQQARGGRTVQLSISTSVSVTAEIRAIRSRSTPENADFLVRIDVAGNSDPDSK